jgi:hypothetical protein
MKHRKKKAPGAYLKKRKVKKYQEGGKQPGVKDLLSYLEGFDPSRRMQVPTSDAFDIPAAQVNLPAAEVVTEGTETTVNRMLPERLAKTEGDLAAIYKNLGSEGVDKYLDMTQGVADAQNRAFEAIRPFLYLTPMGTPAFLSEMTQHPERYNPQSPEGALNLAGALATFGRGKAPQPVTIAERFAMQGLKDKVTEKFRQIFPRKPEIVPGTGRPQGAPSQPGMFSAMEEAAVEAEILSGEEAVLGQRGLPRSPEMARIEGQNIGFRRNTNLGQEMARKAASKIPYKSLRDMTPAEYEALAPFGAENRAAAFINELGKIQHRQHADVYGNTTEPVHQIPSLMIGGELEKRTNKQGMIPKAQLAQFLNKGGLGTFDKAVLEQAMMELGTVPGKKGKEFYNLRDLRNLTASILQDRFSVDETSNYAGYGTNNLRGPKVEIQPIGTKLITANRESELGKSYIGASSGHWTGISPDIVAHYRGFVRGGNLADTRILYISEMQSDVAQSGRFLKDSYDYVPGFPEDIMRQAPDENGVMRYTYRFPADAYSRARRYSTSRNLPVARNPHELFFNIPVEFDIEATAPSGYDDVMEQIKDVMSDGVITPDNEFLYDVNYWMGVQEQVKDLYRSYRDLDRNSKEVANKFYKEALKLFQDINPGLELEFLPDEKPDFRDIAVDMETAVGDIIEALERNDVNPPGTFTDAYIQSAYDQSLESFKNLLDLQRGYDAEIARIFHDGTYRDMEDIGSEYPAQDEKIQSHFVKNQDEFLLSQIIQQNGQYNAIRFPTGQTTGIIQGFFRSPARYEEEIQRTRESIENLRGDVTRANNLINNPDGEIEGFKSVFQDGSTTYFGDQIDLLGPTTQELLFGTKIVGDSGTPRFTDIEGYAQRRPDNNAMHNQRLEQLVYNPDNTESSIYEGKVSPEMQRDVHLYNFLTFVHAFGRGRVRSRIADLRAQEFKRAALDIATTINREPGRLHSNVNYVMQIYAIDPKYPKTGQDMLAKYEAFKGSTDMEEVIMRLRDNVERYALQHPYDYTGMPSTPTLETEAYLNGDFLDHPAYKKYMDVNDPGGRDFQQTVIDEFSRHMARKGDFNPWKFSDELTLSVGDMVHLYLEHYGRIASNDASQIVKNQRAKQLAEMTFGVSGGPILGWNVGPGIGYGDAQKLIFMPIAQTPSGPRRTGAMIQELGYMVTESELQDFLVQKAVELNKLGGAKGDDVARTRFLTNFRTGIENLGYSMKKGALANQNIGSQQTHLQSQEDQLRAVLRGEGVRDDLKTVMNSYDRLPKIAKKMGYTLKPVTDQHGNEWFELEVPQSIQRGEGEVRGYRYGGKVKVKKKSPFKVIKR